LNAHHFKVKNEQKCFWRQVEVNTRPGKSVGDKFDKLIGLVQEKFGYTQQQAEEEFNQRLTEVKTEGE
jgi:hypothetical protein